MSTDPRVEAATITYVNSFNGAAVLNVDRDVVRSVLTAADQADREQGIHRVKVDDTTVERVADAAFESMRPKFGFPTRFENAPTPLQDDYRTIARAVLAALTGAES